MSLSQEDVAEGMAILGSAFRRRISAEMTAVYHRVLTDRLDQRQFRIAVRDAVEHEDEFPTVSKLLTYGEAIRPLDGVPHIHGRPLSEYLEEVKRGGGEP